MPGNRAHVIHADGGNGFQARVDLCRAEGKTAAAAYAQYADTVTINEVLRSEIINGGTEGLSKQVRRDQVARLPLAFAPERQVNGESDEALFCQFLRVEHGRLFL